MRGDKMADQIKQIKTMQEKVSQTVESFLLAPLVMSNKVASELSKPIVPLMKNVDKTVKEINEGFRQDMTRILFTTRHKNLLEAMIADFVDVIPGLGNITEAERLADARRLGDRDAVVAHGIDTAVGEVFSIIPVFGELIDSFLDALLPANTLLYLKRRGLIEWHPPLLPQPKISIKLKS